MTVPKKPGIYKVKGGRYMRRFANGKVSFVKGPSRSKSTTKRRAQSRSAPAKRRTPTRKSMPRRKTTRRRSSKVVHLAPLAANANAVIQFAEPFLPAAASASQGNLQAAAGQFKAGVKEAVSTQNLLQAGIPVAAVGMAGKLARALGVPNPGIKFGNKTVKVM